LRYAAFETIGSARSNAEFISSIPLSVTNACYLEYALLSIASFTLVYPEIKHNKYVKIKYLYTVTYLV